MSAVKCPELNPHPIAAEIAATFEVAYEDVIRWFCDGQTFEEILVGLQTAELSEVDTERLFEERAVGKTWEQIWRELGITVP